VLRRLVRRCAFRLGTSDAVERLVLGAPPLRAAATRRARRYVDEGDALRTVEELAAAGLSPSVDIFGENTGATFAVARAVAAEGLPAMATVQANLRRSVSDVEELTVAGIPIRLVKGAYVEAGAVAHPWGPATDAAFVALAERLSDLGADHALATHDPAILSRLAREGGPLAIEFLLGVRPDEARRLAAAGHRVRIYVPFGSGWFRYYGRRVAESIGA
jgi:hypothetical protein